MTAYPSRPGRIEGPHGESVDRVGGRPAQHPVELAADLHRLIAFRGEVDADQLDADPIFLALVEDLVEDGQDHRLGSAGPYG